MAETRYERAPIGGVDANARLQVPCNPASRMERATGIDTGDVLLGKLI